MQGFEFLTDILIIEMKEDVNQTLILGHPFLAMGGVLINAESGDLTFWMNNKRFKISICEAKRKSDNGVEERFVHDPL